MDNLFLFIFRASLVCLIIGLIKPTIFSRFTEGEITRKKIGLFYVIFNFAFFVIFGIMTYSNQQTQENAYRKLVEQKIYPK
ncbi:MAG: hypothetical protein HQK91_07695 [Nitrospirae bacterium]|nr:hypothetical protein [Nitrospirota bacterium]MBF0541317.1 hypothetical protein [Nitrospirota bacterium]